MPSALISGGPVGPRRGPGRLFCLVVVLAFGIGVACTPSGPAPPGTGSGTSAGRTTGTGSGSPATGSTRSGPTSNGTPTAGSNPSGGGGSDHFVPFRTTVPGSAAGRRIGLIGLDQTDPFSKSVTESIKEQAQIAGAEIVYCDAENSAEVALRCARRLASQRVDAWITFQPVSSAGQAICAAGPRDVPMISIDGSQGDCQSARAGIDDDYAGSLVGGRVGEFARQQFGCQVDTVILLGDPGHTPADRQRVVAARTALSTFCPSMGERAEETAVQGSSPAGAPATTGTDSPVVPGGPTASGSGAAEPGGPTVLELDAPGQQSAFDLVGKALTSVPDDGRVLVIGADDGLTLGAVRAAKAAGRLDSVYVAGIGADSRSYCEIATDAHWIGDAGSFPEKYGSLVVPYLIDLMDRRPVAPELFLRNEFIDATTIAGHYDVSSCGPAR